MGNCLFSTNDSDQEQHFREELNRDRVEFAKLQGKREAYSKKMDDKEEEIKSLAKDVQDSMHEALQKQQSRAYEAGAKDMLAYVTDRCRQGGSDIPSIAGGNSEQTKDNGITDEKIDGTSQNIKAENLTEQGRVQSQNKEAANLCNTTEDGEYQKNNETSVAEQESNAASKNLTDNSKEESMQDQNEACSGNDDSAKSQYSGNSEQTKDNGITDEKLDGTSQNIKAENLTEQGRVQSQNKQVANLRNTTEDREYQKNNETRVAEQENNDDSKNLTENSKEESMQDQKEACSGNDDSAKKDRPTKSHAAIREMGEDEDI